MSDSQKLTWEYHAADRMWMAPIEDWSWAICVDSDGWFTLLSPGYEEISKWPTIRDARVEANRQHKLWLEKRKASQ